MTKKQKVFFDHKLADFPPIGLEAGWRERPKIEPLLRFDWLHGALLAMILFFGLLATSMHMENQALKRKVIELGALYAESKGN